MTMLVSFTAMRATACATPEVTLWLGGTNEVSRNVIQVG
jgi:hypothetical protein